MSDPMIACRISVRPSRLRLRGQQDIHCPLDSRFEFKLSALVATGNRNGTAGRADVPYAEPGGNTGGLDQANIDVA
jgi:hypothetical protein